MVIPNSSDKRRSKAGYDLLVHLNPLFLFLLSQTQVNEKGTLTPVLMSVVAYVKLIQAMRSFCLFSSFSFFVSL